jgi:hypothetical protein
MQGTIVLKVMEGARRAKEATKLGEEYIERMERLEEREALAWLWKSEIDVDKETVLKLFEKPLRRVWTRRGYSQRWIDKQFRLLTSR